MGVALALLVTFAWVGGVIFGWGINGMRLTKRHASDLRDIRQQLENLRRVD